MKLNLKIVAATAAVAMMSSGAAFAAATISAPGGAYNFSSEGLTLTGTGAVTLPNIVVTFGNNLTYQDDIIITVGNTTSIAAVPAPGLVTCATLLPPPTTPPALGYVTTTTNGWAFRVTSVSGVNLGDTCTFSGLQVQGGSLVNNPTLGYKALRFGTGQQVDQATNASDFLVKSQFGISVQQALNGTIDVYQDRLAFTDDETVAPGDTAAPLNQGDTLNWSTTVDLNGTVWYGPTVTTSAQSVAVVGDFTWADDNGNGTCTTAELGSTGVGNGGVVLSTGAYAIAASSTCNVLVMTGPAGDAIPDLAPPQAGNTVQTGFFYVPGDVILNPTDWTATVQFDYFLTGSPAKTGSKQLPWDPGIWKINGAQVYIQYMPFGADISRIIYAANTGAINADVDIDVWYAGAKKTCKAAAPIAKMTVNKLSSAVDACVLSQFGLDASNAGKVAILLTFTAPDKDIEVYSAYNVGTNDRGTVVNTSNGRSFYYGLGL